MSVQLIAEAASNHAGSVSKAIELVHAAKEADADVVKFQMGLDELCAETSEQYEAFRRLELSWDDWPMVQAAADSAGLSIAWSVWGLDALCLLGTRIGHGNLNTPFIKIGSGDLTARDMLEDIGVTSGELEVPVYLSTGMGTEAEIRAAVDALGGRVACLMACTVDYPAPFEQAHLARIETLAGLGLSDAVGWSDHIANPRVGPMAVRLGATVIERHFALEDLPDGSLGPCCFLEYAAACREAEGQSPEPDRLSPAYGCGELRVLPCEEKWYAKARRDPKVGKRV